MMRKTIFTRSFFFTAIMALAGIIVIAQKNDIHRDTKGRFILPPLPYSHDALEPVIGRRTLELHHGKHLKAYIDNLNSLITGTPFENKDLCTIVMESQGAIFNNAGQTLNHYLYFSSFSPAPQKHPDGKLLQAIVSQWETFDKFKEEFTIRGTTLFGSGWLWLSKDNDGKLYITLEKDAGNPVTRDLIPLLGFDLWEHAYYLDYENKRTEHVESIWKIIDWKIIGSRYESEGQPTY